MDALRVLLGWLLVWALGVAVLRRAYARDGSGAVHPAWIAGAGFPVGAFLLVLEMALISRTGLDFGIVTVGAPLVAGLVALVLADRRARRSSGIAPVRPWSTWAWPERGARGVLYALLLAWLGVHTLLLLLEVLRQPLFPWDAWTQWATKAKVWFSLGHMAPFLTAREWLSGTGSGYYDAAPHYPALVPLWQVWSSVALGRFDDALMNLPWWLLGIALALALYGFLRMRAFTPLAALAGTWLIVSMPIFETHIALAGYADLPLAAYLTAAVLAGLLALDRESRAHALVAVVLAAALPMIKNPGWVWLATLVPGVIVARLPRRGMRIALVAWGVAVALAAMLGRFDATILGYHLHLQLDVPWHGLVEAYLSFANWHLLFWFVPAVVLVARRYLDAPGIGPLTAVVVSGALFLMLGFSLTNASVWVEDQSTVNRATLHLAPLLGVWLLLLMQRALPAMTMATQAGDEPVSPPSAPASAPQPAPAAASSVAAGVVPSVASSTAAASALSARDA